MKPFLKRVFKTLLPPSLVLFLKYIVRFKGRGPFVYWKLHWGAGVVSAAIPGLTHPVYLRRQTTDILIFEQIFVHEDGEFFLPENAASIVDAGAHVGMTTVLFANRYPDATVVALEPEEKNFEMLQKNTQKYSRVKPLRAGLWSEDKTLFIKNPGANTWGFQLGIKKQDSQEVPGLSIPTIMKKQNLRDIDLLKVDIEGAEKEVFSNPGLWVKSINALTIEFHEHFVEGCIKAVENAFPKEAFTRHKKGGVQVFLKNP